MTTLELYRGRTDSQSKSATNLVQSSLGSNLRMKAVTASSSLRREPFEEGGDAVRGPARWIFATGFLKSLLSIIPYYLEFVERGASDPPRIEEIDKVVSFRKRMMH